MITTWILVLYFGGLALIIAEVFIPGAICGILGISATIGSAILVVVGYPQYAFFIILFQVIGAAVVIYFSLKLFPYSPFGKAMILNNSQNSTEGWIDTPSDSSLVGKEGDVFTPLRPAGSITIDGKRYGAVSGGDLIEKGEKVRVVEVHGNRIVVERVS